MKRTLQTISGYFLNVQAIKFGRVSLTGLLLFQLSSLALADSVNSPNITLNVDRNRVGGAGAGNTSVAINTITVAETMLGEYSAGTGRNITIAVRPGFQFDPTSNVTAQSATLGFNGNALNVATVLTPVGAADEVLTFNFTSASAQSSTTQDIIRINGIKLLIRSAAGAAGPAQTTLAITTAPAGGAFTDQGIVAANITRGVADHLAFAVEPSISGAGDDLLPVVRIADFGGNTVLNDNRNITLAIQTNPGAATLFGTATKATTTGLATWATADHLHINTAGTGYTLRATHDGASFQTSDSVDSIGFNIVAGSPGGLVFLTQPVDTVAGANILVAVSILDDLGNVVTSSSDPITLDASINPLQWPLLVATSLTKNAVNGVATWSAADELRINKAVEGYSLAASGVGAPIESDAFNILPGDASLVRFVQSPPDGRAGVALDPAVTAEIVDEFGNRTDTAAQMTLELLSAPCGGSISGTTATSAAGLATFGNVKLNKACDDDIISASVTGLVAAVSDPFTIDARNAVPIGLDVLDLSPGERARFSARGAFTIPTTSRDNPTLRGASLTISGETASVNFPLPKKGWRKLGGNKANTSGFQFLGSRVRGSKCRNVTVKGNLISASCSLAENTFQLPESGPVDVELKLGRGTARFCGNCGGTPTGDPTQTFTRIDCEALAVCE